MKKLIFGTTNPSKLAQVRGVLGDLPIEIIGLSGFINLPDVIEDGKTAIENARKKALAFSNSLDIEVFSMDNALYFDNFKDENQPGINVRRLEGHEGRPSDQDVIDYYKKMIDDHGGQISGYFEFAIAIAESGSIVSEIVIHSPKRFFTSKASKMVCPGYPLESLQIDQETGKYISEMSALEQDNFWRESIGIKMRQFFIDYLRKHKK